MKGFGGTQAFQLLRQQMETGCTRKRNPVLLQMLWQLQLDTDSKETGRRKKNIYYIYI